MSYSFSDIRKLLVAAGQISILILPGLLWPTGSWAQNGQTQTIAQSGQTAPDANGVFTFIVSPTINDSGQVAFSAVLNGTSGGDTDNSGIFHGNGGTITQIAREGQTVPNGNGSFSLVGTPSLNESGQAAFFAGLDATSGGTTDNSGIFGHSDGNLTQIIRAGQTAPDANGLFSGFSSPSLNSSGQVAFSASLTGTSGGDSDDNGIFRVQGGSITQIARAGQAAPDTNGSFNNLVGTVLNDSGQVAFFGFLTGTSGGFADNTGIFRGSGGNVARIMRKGQMAPDANGLFSVFSTEPVFNDSGQVAIRAFLNGTSGGITDNSGIFRGSGGGITQIAREGQTAPDANGSFSAFASSLSLNNSGHVAFFADLIGTSGGTTDNTGIFRGDGVSLTQIARAAQSAPDGNGVFSGFETPVLNDSGQVAFFADLSGTSGGTTDNAGIFTSDGIDFMEVARTGDALSGSTISTLTLRPNDSLNRHGQIAYRAFLENGDRVIRRWTPDLHWRLANLGVWENSNNWTLGLDPSSVHRTFIDPDFDAVVLGPTSYTRVQQLVVGGGQGDASLVLQQGTTIEVDNGLAVAPNGTLMGTGNIAGDVSVRGTLAPSTGSSGTGVISITDDLDLVGAIVEIELAGINFGEFDFLAIGGDLSIDAQLLVSIDPTFNLASDMEFLIARINDERIGEFEGLGHLDLVGNFGGTDLFIDYFAGDGNDIALFTAAGIPEPFSFSLCLLVGLIGFSSRRRQTR